MRRRSPSPSRAAYAKSYKARDRSWQRKFDEKNKELADLQTQLASAELELKGSKEKVSELQTCNKHQSAMIAVYKQNEMESDKRFEQVTQEIVRPRIKRNNLIANRDKMLKTLQFEIQEDQLDPIQSQSSTSQSPDMFPARVPVLGPKASREQSDDDDASSDSESSKEEPPTHQKHVREPEQTLQTAAAAVVERSLSAETLPMSPRMPLAESFAHATDMPEPSMQPVAFEPGSATSAPESRQEVSAIIQ